MYYIVYALFYAISLLPNVVLYALADFIYFLLYYVFGYRKKVVFGNLAIAFPEKTVEQRTRIAKDFYHGFVDTFIETIMLFSMSPQNIQKRFVANVEVINQLHGRVPRVQLVSGHFFNWELGNLSLVQQFHYQQFLAVYQSMGSPLFERLMRTLRQKFGTTMIPTKKFKTEFSQYTQNEYIFVIVADQNPSNYHKAVWTEFFGKITPFAPGPEKGAEKFDTAIVYAHFYRVKRGYYKADFELIAENVHGFEPGEITKILVNKVEQSIRKMPANYLWSHRRWKKEYSEQEFGHLKV